MKDNVYLVATSAFMVAGSMILADDIVEVSDSEARDLLSRGKARVATAEDGVPQDDEGQAEVNAALDADDAEQAAADALEAEAAAAQDAAQAEAAATKTKK